MQRFFFHRTDGDFDPDNQGTEFPNLATAKLDAVRFAAESVKESPEDVWLDGTFRVEVSDEQGMLLCMVIVLGIDTPAARGLKKPRHSER